MLYFATRGRCFVSRQLSKFTLIKNQSGIRFLNISSSSNTSHKRRVETDIWVSDSLAHGSKVQLTLNEAGNLKWYTCGPTVYDAAHLGHARNYVTVDILQRIITQYFGVEVIHVMGVTDIDDKILRRAQERGIKPRELAAQYEREFFEDLYRLGVCTPIAITRVTEHIPHILACVMSALRAGFAYRASSGSVYFDTVQFDKLHQTLPQPLRRESTTTHTDADTDPDLITPFLTEKRDPRDFALWKRSFSTDSTALSLARSPLPSSWPTLISHEEQQLFHDLLARGRPGWHIECVAMSSAVFGPHFDVHSGGIDLLFPHHHNEYLIAYATRSFQQQQQQQQQQQSQEPWVRYFLHVGHLHIQGLKMSKSLKNFITIREFLERYTANEFRLFCLQTRYQSPVDYSETRMAEVAQVLSRFDEFFINIAECITEFIQNHSNSSSLDWQEPEIQLFKRFEAIQQSVHSALCDNFDTPSVLRALYELIHEVNLYIQAHRRRVNIFLLTRIAHYLYRLLTVFGLNIKLPSSLSLVSPFAVGITANSSSSSVMTAATKSISVDSNALLCTLIKFREETRKHILNYDKNEWTTVQQQILKLTDQMRAQLLEWGVQLEDHEHATRIRVQSPDTTPASKQQLEEMRQKSRQRQEELARLATIPPQEYLRDDTKFSAYDELGIPTHTITGSPLSSSQRKKLEKRYYKHKRAYERYCASLPTNKPTTQPQQQFDGTKDIESHKKN